MRVLRCDRNLSPVAAALGVNRHTVANRLRAVEEALGRPIAGNATEIEAALRFEASADDTTVVYPRATLCERRL